jgi:LacI family transcriptional regulator
MAPAGVWWLVRVRARKRLGAMRQRPRVALLIETSNEYARDLLRGIIAYIREHRPWSIYLSEQGRGGAPPAWLRHWDGHGIIARIENRHIARAVRATGLPAVDVSAARLVPELPWVETDDQAISALAAEHLLERGFRHFAFCGAERFQWSLWRRDAFVATIRAAGYDCQVFADGGGPADQEQARLGRWVRGLAKPVGVMAAYDLRGRQVIDACREEEIAVPDELAVVGVDNDELICELCDPPMSSVRPQAERTGYAAARLLDEMLNGRPLRERALRIAPQAVITRRSSDVLAIEDAEISALVRFIRDNACDGIDVGDLLRRTALSRRVLESRFRALFGHTPHEQILRAKLARVKELLLDSELTLAEIAERSGFAHVEYLSVVFKKKVGQTPSAFRAKRFVR